MSAQRMLFLVMATIILGGIWLTGFDRVHWFLYVPVAALAFAGVTGVILAEARWAMYYVPVGGYLAGLALLLGFFLVTGLLHSHLTRRLNNVVALEYAGIAAAGVLLVSIAGQAGLG